MYYQCVSYFLHTYWLNCFITAPCVCCQSCLPPTLYYLTSHVTINYAIVNKVVINPQMMDTLSNLAVSWMMNNKYYDKIDGLRYSSPGIFLDNKQDDYCFWWLLCIYNSALPIHCFSYLIFIYLQHYLLFDIPYSSCGGMISIHSHIWYYYIP